MLPSKELSVRLDGGECPRHNKIIEDADGWIFGGFEFTPQADADAIALGINGMALEMSARRRMQTAISKRERLIAWWKFQNARFSRAWQVFAA